MDGAVIYDDNGLCLSISGTYCIMLGRGYCSILFLNGH